MLWYKQGGPITYEKVRCEPYWGKERVLAKQLAEVTVLQAERAVKANSQNKARLICSRNSRMNWKEGECSREVVRKRTIIQDLGLYSQTTCCNALRSDDIILFYQVVLKTVWKKARIEAGGL